MILKFRSIEAKVYPLSMRCFPNLSKLANVLVSAVITITLSFLSGITCCDFKLLKLPNSANQITIGMCLFFIIIVFNKYVVKVRCANYNKVLAR